MWFLLIASCVIANVLGWLALFSSDKWLDLVRSFFLIAFGCFAGYLAYRIGSH